MAEEEVKRGRGRPPKNLVTDATGRADRKMTKRMWLWLVLAVIVIAVAVSGFFYWRYRDAQRQVNRLKDPAEAAKVEAQQLVDKVGKLTDLPKGETPTIATVSDVAKLKSQTFFADAQNGDKALIYTQAKKAYLYRPSTNKLINIAPLNIGSNSSSSTQ